MNACDNFYDVVFPVCIFMQPYAVLQLWVVIRKLDQQVTNIHVFVWQEFLQAF